MDYAELEEKYERFKNHPSYSKLEDLIKGKDLESIGKIQLFFTVKFKVRKKQIYYHREFPVLINNNKYSFDLTKAPNFDDQDDFLRWLHQEIHNQM